MSLSSWLWIWNGRGKKRSGSSRQVARMGAGSHSRKSHCLNLEELEERCVPMGIPIQAISLPPPNTLPSDTAAGDSTLPSISADGRFVAFQSLALNLLPNQGQGFPNRNVFLQDTQGDLPILVSRDPNQPNVPLFGTNPIISSDGGHVAYQSVNGRLLVYDRVADQNILVNHIPGNPNVQAGGVQSGVSVAGISGDGRRIVYTSDATNLVPGQVDSPFTSDLFVYDRDVSGNGVFDEPGDTQTSLVSHVAGSPVTAAEGVALSSSDIVISEDGNWIAFTHDGDNLVAGQVNQFSFERNVFLYEVATGSNLLVTRQVGSDTITSNGSRNTRPAISEDGQFVAFISDSSDLVANTVNGGGNQVYLFDRDLKENQMVSHAAGNATTTGNADSGEILDPEVGTALPGIDISDDGQLVVYASLATDLVANQTQQAGASTDINLFVFDATSGLNALVSHVPASSTQATGEVAVVQETIEVLADARLFRISGDGQFITYPSTASNLVDGQSDSGNVANLFRYEVGSGTNTLISQQAGSPTQGGDGLSQLPAVSRDGLTVAYSTLAGNVAPGLNDFNGSLDVALFAGGTTRVLSLAAEQIVGEGNSWIASVADDNPNDDIEDRYVVFTSSATNLIPGQRTNNRDQNIYLFDKMTQTTALVNHLPGDPLATADAGIGAFSFLQTQPPPEKVRPMISADARWVVFVSEAGNLVPNLDIEPNQGSNVFLYEIATGEVTLVSIDNSSSSDFLRSEHPVISANGRYVAFLSQGLGLLPGVDPMQFNQDFFPQVYLLDRDMDGDGIFDEVGDRQILLASHAVGQQLDPANSFSLNPALSDDGKFLVFESLATNLVPPGTDTNDKKDIYLFDRDTREVRLVSQQAASNLAANGTSTNPVISFDGNFVAFVSDATNLVAGQQDTNLAADVFLYDVQDRTNLLVSRAAGSSTATGNGGSPFENVTVMQNVFQGDQGGPIQVSTKRSVDPALSGEGRFVASQSNASNLVVGQVDTNGTDDVFLFDRLAGTTSLVSHAAGSAITTADGASSRPAIDEAGDRLAYLSEATNLVPGQTAAPGGGLFTASVNVFQYDRNLDLNLVYSGSEANFDVTSLGQAYLPIIGRNSDLHFSGTNIIFAAQNTGAFGVSYFNNGGLISDVVLSSASLSVGAGPNTPVGNLSATSNFAGQTILDLIQFTLDPTLLNNSLFAIGPQFAGSAPLVTGFTAQQAASLQVQARASVSESFAVRNFTITVAGGSMPPPQNDAPTGLSLSSNTVAENQPVGTAVGTFATTDPNAGNTFVYSLVGGEGSADNALFQINGSTLVTGASFDFEARNSYTIRVQTTDQGALSFQQVFTITITDVPEPTPPPPEQNQAPTDLSISEMTTRGNLPAGTAVGNLTAIDPDAGDTFTFELVEGPGGEDNGLFAIDGNTLRTAAVLDPSAQLNYSLRLKVTDAGGLAFEKVMVVSVLAPDSRGIVDSTGFLNPEMMWYLGADPQPFAYGLPGWKPLINDWDGDGTDTVGAFNPSTATWYLRNSNTSGIPDFTPFAYGGLGWIPVAGDWDGDGIDTPGVFDPFTGTWYLRNTNEINDPGPTSFSYGGPGWRPAVGDWDGDGIDTIGVVNPLTGVWYVRNTNSPGAPDVTPFSFGLGWWMPLPGRLDHSRQALRLAQPASLNAGATLGQGQLQGVVDAALQRLASAEVDASVVQRLAQAQYLVADLPTGLLGLAEKETQRVWISADAAGHRWFVDPTPQGDEEFASGLALEGSEAQQGVDLLSVVLHEMGHLAGLDHQHDELTEETLGWGYRNLDALDALMEGGA